MTTEYSIGHRVYHYNHLLLECLVNEAWKVGVVVGSPVDGSLQIYVEKEGVWKIVPGPSLAHIGILLH